MNLKKILTGVVAGAMAVSAMSVASFAAEDLVSPVDWSTPNELFNESALKDLDNYDKLYTGNLSVTYHIDVAKDHEWANGTVIVRPQYANGDLGWVAQPFGGSSCEGQSWFAEDAYIIEDDATNFSITITLDMTDMKGISVCGQSGNPGDEPNGFFKVTSVELENEAGFKAVYADGKATVPVEEPAPDDTQQPAPPTTEGLETALYVGNSVDWNIVSSESVFVAIGNEYTYSVSGLDIAPDKLTVIYIKDVAVENKEAEKSDIDPVKVTVTSLKINGNEVAVKEGVPTGLNENGVFDIAYFNTWGDSFIDLPEENINSVEITVKVEKADPAPVDTEATDPEATDPEATDPEATNPEDTSAAAAGTGDSTPTGTGDNNQPTGIAIAIVPAVIAAAGVIVAKKRK